MEGKDLGVELVWSDEEFMSDDKRRGWSWLIKLWSWNKRSASGMNASVLGEREDIIWRITFQNLIKDKE